MTDQEVEERYRISRVGIEKLIRITEDDVSPVCARSHPLDATTKVSIDTRNILFVTPVLFGITQTCLFKYIEKITIKKGKFSDKNF